LSNVDSNIRQPTLNITLLTNAARRFSDLEAFQTPVISTAHHLVIALCTGKVVNLDVSIVVKMNITHGFAPQLFVMHVSPIIRNNLKTSEDYTLICSQSN
jgi:hypothetical protein